MQAPKDPKKKGADMLGNIEDCMTKLVRLIANIATEEQHTYDCLVSLKDDVDKILS